MAPPRYKYSSREYPNLSSEQLEPHYESNKDRIQRELISESMDVDTTSNKRVADSSQDAGPSKRIATGNSSDGVSSSQVEAPIVADDIQQEMGLTGTGKEQASGGASSQGLQPYHIERPISLFGYKESVYRKTHKFMTFGLAPNVISATETAGIQERYLTTSLAEIPWMLPALYLNQSEFDLLPTGTYAKSVHIEAIYRGSTIQFETAASATALATLNQINDIYTAVALNKTGWGSDVSFTSFNTTEPMIPTGVQAPKYNAITTGTNLYRGMVADYYGVNNSNVNFEEYIPHHQIARHTFLYNYFMLSARTAASAATAGAGGWYPLVEKINQMDGKTVVNTCVLKTSYEPRMGWLKTPLKTVAHGMPWNTASGGTASSQAVPTQGNLVSSRVMTADRNGTASADGNEFNVTEGVNGLSNDFGVAATEVPTPTIYTPIEKSQISRTGFWGSQDPHIQPSVHIGVQPVPSLNTGSLTGDNPNTNAWTNTRAYWEVNVTMVVMEHQPTAVPYAAIANVPLGDNVLTLVRNDQPSFNINPSNQGATFAGLYPLVSKPAGLASVPP